MSKFDELCQTYHESRNAYIANRDATWDFAMQFIGGLIKYLGIPENEAKMLPIENHDRKKTYTVMGALSRQADGWWSLWLQFIVYEKKGVFPQMPVALRLGFRIENDGYHFKYSSLPDSVISSLNQNALEASYADIFNRIKQELVWNASDSDKDTEATRSIGFS